MKSSRKKLLGAIILLLFLVPFVRMMKKVYRELRQPELNRSLITAVKKNDQATVVVLLREGGDPNAGSLPPDTRSLWRQLWDRLQGKPIPTAVGPPTLFVALGMDDQDNKLALPLPKENVSLVRALLDARANANSTDAVGITPLMLAAIGTKRETVRLLLDRGAQVNTRSAMGDTVLLEAASRSDMVLVQLLLARGALATASDSQGLTPLHLAAIMGRTENMRLLLKSGARVDARDRSGVTPLLEAIQFDHDDSVELLLANGAQANVSDKQGNNPLTFARDNNNSDIVRMLKKAGAKE